MERNMYYLQFRAISINRFKNKRSNRFNYSRTLSLKINIQDTSTQPPLTIAESVQWAQTEAIQGTIKCLNATLKAQLSAHEEEGKEWTVKFLGHEQTPLQIKLEALDQSDEQTTAARPIKGIGHCKLNPFIYVEVFNQSGKTKFEQHVQISPSLSLDYQVYIHSTSQGLREVLREEDSKSQLKVVDLSFKKNQGLAKIRCVQLRENRQKSLRVQQFYVHQQNKISSLKKSGAKFVPIRQQPSPRNATGGKQRKKGRQSEHRFRERNSNKLDGQLRQSLSLREGEKMGFSLLNVLYLLALVLAIMLAGYVMVPSRKV